MTRHMQSILSCFCSTAALSIALALNPASAASPNPTVTVVNTPAQPVPVTGTVTGQITGTVKIDPTGNTVKAQQNGAWGVTVNEPVTVEPGTNPLQVTIAGGALSNSAANGYLLVITDVEWKTQKINSVGDERPGDIVHFVGLLNGHQILESAATIAADDYAGGSEHFSTGIPVASVPSFELHLGSGIQAGNQAHTASIQGYLVPE